MEMQKYAARKEETSGDHFAKLDILSHKFRSERNFYLDAFLVVVILYVTKNSNSDCVAFSGVHHIWWKGDWNYKAKLLVCNANKKPI
jgi:hypothetical protein